MKLFSRILLVPALALMFAATACETKKAEEKPAETTAPAEAKPAETPAPAENAAAPADSGAAKTEDHSAGDGHGH